MSRPRTAPVAQPLALGRPVPPCLDVAGFDRTAARLARGLGDAIAGLGCAATVTAGDACALSLREWKAGLAGPVCVARYRDRALKPGILVSIPPALVGLLVDSFYGGSGDPDGTVETLGHAGQRFFARFAGRLAETLGAAWPDGDAPAPEFVSSAFAPDDVALGAKDLTVFVQTVAVAVGAAQHSVAFVFPLATVRERAGQGEGATEETTDGTDRVWRLRLENAVLQTRLPVRTILARPSMPVARLLALREGDIIPVTLPARVPVTVAGRLMAHGTIGEANGRAAIKIEHLEQGNCTDV